MKIRELAQIRKEHKRELEYEKFDGYELPPRTQFSMLNKPAVSIKYGVMKFNMACIPVDKASNLLLQQDDLRTAWSDIHELGVFTKNTICGG